MRNTANKNQLKQQILEKELQIQKMHLHQGSSELCESIYNTLILEKAILKKDLESLEKNIGFEKIKRIFTHNFATKNKLICDYWQK